MVISPVTEPTDWANSIVCNIKKKTVKGAKVRLCLDPKDLSRNIRREHYYSRTIDEILPQLHKSFFSVVDSKKGYWHIELDEESSLLCTFITLFGRFKFNRLPFGIKVSQDVFQRKLDKAYQCIDKVCGIADDIITAGETLQEHDTAMVRMLEASRKNNISLNSEKLQFKQQKVNFYGHRLTDAGIQPSEDKLLAIKNLKEPENGKELQTVI